MSSAVLNKNWIESSSDYLIDEEPTKLSNPLIKLYARSVKDHYEELRDAKYLPTEITPQHAQKLLKSVKRSIKWFNSLEKQYAKIKDVDPLINEIYQDFVNINFELELAEERLNKLSDPVVHERILKAVSKMKTSIFLRE